MAESVTLDFLARQLDAVLEEQGRLREDMAVVMARLERVEAYSRSTAESGHGVMKAVLDELRAMHRRDDRLARDLGRLEGRQPAS